MSEVVLINPLWEKKRGNVWREVSGCLPPLGLGYLASSLEHCDISVKIIDANAENISDIEIIERLKKILPNFIGITATTVNINLALKLAEDIKNIFPQTKIVFGGVHATVEPDSILSNSFVDYVFRDEAEKIFPMLFKVSNLTDIPSLSYKQNGKVIHNQIGPVLLNLDLIPMPAWHLMPVHLYKPSLGNYKRLPGIGMISSRGCFGKCTFCFVGANNKKVRCRSVPNVINEILYLQEKFGIKEISFYDDNFTNKKEFVKELCNSILEKEIDITWTCASRVDTVNEEILRLMEKSGCHQISFGIESADEQILKNIRKQTNLNIAKEIIKTTKKVGIGPKIYLMFGSPGETKETLNKTLNFALDSFAVGFIISITTPFPGTELYRWAVEKGYLNTKNWEEFDASRPVMELPTVSTDFLRKFYASSYKKLYLRPKYIFERLLDIRSFESFKKNILAFKAIIGL